MKAARSALASAALLLVAGCRGARDPVASEEVDLAAFFEYSHVESDALDLPFLLGRERLGHTGWAPEKPGSAPVLWSRRRTAELSLPFYSAAAKELLFRARSHEALGRVRLALALNGQSLGSVDLGPEEKEFRLPLPPAAQRPGENTLAFAMPRVFEQSQQRGERRPRGLALTGLETRPSGSPGRVPPTGRHEQRLWLPPGSSLAYDLRSEEAQALEIQAQAGAARPARFSVWRAAGPSAVALGDWTMGPQQRRRERVALGGRPGELFRLRVVNPGEGGLWIDTLKLHFAPPRAQPPAALPARPSVVVFLVDTLRADHLGAYGHAAATSPRFDAFAREATVFEDAWAQSSWTRPAVASLFTGLAPDAHGVRGLHGTLVPRFGFDQGFEAWNGGNEAALFGKPAKVVVDAALHWLDGVAGPFFLYVHTLDPHGPYTPDQEHWAPFLFEGYRGIRSPTALAHRQRLTADELRFLRSAYEGEVRQNDAAFGALLDGLRGRGVLDRSLVVFTADHGEEFRDHGGGGHGQTLYQEVLRIPLGVRFPDGARRGARDRKPVQQTDLLPTLLALAGVPPPVPVEGRDLSARWLARGKAADAHEPVLVSRLEFSGKNKRAVRSGSLKLILNEEPGWRGEPEELYDLAADPAESRNLRGAAAVPAGYLKMQAALLRAAGQALNRRLEAGHEIELSAEEEQQLRALGYLQ
jgi:arylsulfatase A-like enzyme